MGFYLNSNDSLSQYRDETAKPYFIDKTGMLEKLIPLVEQGGNSLCITRPGLVMWIISFVHMTEKIRGLLSN